MPGTVSRVVWYLSGGMFALCLAVGTWFVVSEITSVVSTRAPEITFSVTQGESVKNIASDLAANHIIRHPLLFRLYLVASGRDRSIHAGEFTVEAPITMARVAAALAENAAAAEKTITIIPGWDLRDIAAYLQSEGLIESDQVFFSSEVGLPAHRYSLKAQLPLPLLAIDAWQMHIATSTFGTDLQLPVLESKPWDVGLEGYLAPDTYRIFANATVHDVVLKLLRERDAQFTSELMTAVRASGHSIHDVLTLASVVEREVRGDVDRAMVADIFWRRVDAGMPLQADSTVHYAVGKKGDLFTTVKDRESDNAWNTYKYPGLPPGPIATPSLSSIIAAIHPQKNNYWFFLTTPEGEVKYAKTLDEHNRNVQKYLR